MQMYDYLLIYAGLISFDDTTFGISNVTVEKNITVTIM